MPTRSATAGEGTVRRLSVVPRHIGLDLLYVAPGETGGMETYARALVPRLADALPGAQLTVFAGRELAAEWRREPWDPRLRLVALPVSARSRVVRSAAQQAVVAAAALRARVDLLHSLGNFGPLRGPRVRVVTMHDLIYLRHPETTTSFLGRGLQRLAPAVARSATRIIAVSQATADDLHELLGVPRDKVDVVPSGPGLTTHAAPTPEGQLRAELGLGDRRLVLSVSARRPHKNLLRLIDAVARLGDDVALVLPGYPGPQDAELTARAAALGIGHRVHVCGWVSDAQLEGLYAAATCLAFPSLAEGFGLPVLEAMTRGLPVACSDVSALPEVAGDAALLFDPLDVSAIAAATERLLRDEVLRDRLAEAGRRRAAQFSWERAAAGTAASYARALGR